MTTNQRPHIILFGITGEPLQNGHLETYLSLVKNYGGDNTSVFIMPNAVPHYKNNRMDLALKQQMYNEVIPQLPLNKHDKPLFQFLLCEIMQECAAGGFNVLTYLKGQHPDWDISIAIGMDSFLSFDTLWSNWQQIPSLCKMIVLERQGHSGEEFTNKEAFLRQEVTNAGYNFGQIQLHNPHSRELSSTQCARKLREGEDCTHDIPKPCLEFIYCHEGCFKDFSTPRPKL